MHVYPSALPENVAIKAMDKHEIMKRGKSKMVLKERGLLTKLSQLGSRHTIQLFMSFVDSQNLYLVQEICRFGTLAMIRHDQRLSPDNIRSYSAQIQTGIQFMHLHSIIHCDLKPENIMIADNCIIKIIDFGCAVDLQNEFDAKEIEFAGTADYVSPEVVIGGKSDKVYESDVPEDGNSSSLPHYSSEYAPAIDLWAFGCIIYFLFCGESPFHDMSEHLTLNRIIKYAQQDWILREKEGLIKSFFNNGALMRTVIDLVEKLLMPHPKDRLGMDSAGHDSIMAHHFFQGYNWSCDHTSAISESERPQSRIKAATKKELMQDGLSLPFDFFT
jgi:serine/threonine protein kinase